METQVYEQQAAIAKAIAHPVRVSVLHFLKDGEQCVCDIAQTVGTERTNLSKHLALMTAAGILDSRRDGLKVMYRLKAPCVLKFLDALTECLIEQAAAQQKILATLKQ